MAELRVAATRITQKSHTLYVFTMNSEQLAPLTYVTPRSHDDPDEVQRIVDPKRAKAIGEYIKGSCRSPERDRGQPHRGRPDRKPRRTDGVTVLFPDDDGKFAYILDGQHRLEGFKYSDGVEFDLPVVAIYNADETLRGKGLRRHQQQAGEGQRRSPPSLYYQIKDLPVDQGPPAMDVIEAAKQGRRLAAEGADQGHGWRQGTGGSRTPG